MLTDLHLQKYLQGLLSEEENREVEAMLEKSEDMRAKLEALKNQSQVLGKPMWQRVLLEKKTRRGSRTRYSAILPALLLLVVILMVSGHWFSRPGSNSTFTLSGGNGSAMELLYDSKTGWRYLDAGFQPGDSLTFSVRDEHSYRAAVVAVYGAGSEAQVKTLWESGPDRSFGKSTAKPVFALDRAGNPGLPRQFVVFYDEIPLPELPPARVLDLLAYQGNERGGLEFHYQVFSAGR